MKNKFICFRAFLTIVFFCFFGSALAQENPSDTLNIRKEYQLPDPTQYEAYYDVGSAMYYLYPKVGNVVVGAPIAMTPAEYKRYTLSNALSSYYREKSDNKSLTFRKDQTDAKKKGLFPALQIKNKIFVDCLS